MTIALIILTALLALALLASAAAKLRRQQAVVATIEGVGVPSRLIPLLALAEIAAVIGLVLGLWWAPLGIAAAAGAALYFIGAVTAHLRIGDRGVVGAAVHLVLALAVLAVSIAALQLS